MNSPQNQRPPRSASRPAATLDPSLSHTEPADPDNIEVYSTPESRAAIMRSLANKRKRSAPDHPRPVRGRNNPRTKQLHCWVLPHVWEEVYNESVRRGAQQGALIEEAWELYKQERKEAEKKKHLMPSSLDDTSHTPSSLDDTSHTPSSLDDTSHTPSSLDDTSHTQTKVPGATPPLGRKPRVSGATLPLGRKPRGPNKRPYPKRKTPSIPSLNAKQKIRQRRSKLTDENPDGIRYDHEGTTVNHGHKITAEDIARINAVKEQMVANGEIAPPEARKKGENDVDRWGYCRDNHYVEGICD